MADEPVNTGVDQVAALSVEYRMAYPVIALPPLLAGAVQVTFDCRAPVAADTDVGAFGSVKGISEEEFVEYEPVPTEFLAAT